MTRFGLDVVKGKIFGGLCIRGDIYHEGRFQQTLFAESESELRDKAELWLKEHGGKDVYPNGAELRVFA